ncbi:hypothetical protein, partial [Chitinophaga ginsengisoli]|uniref:hypothetical protein n=1 Tax=Chitinophaga ginsengisoli TaxID=363837 RepID=UPI001B803715
LLPIKPITIAPCATLLLQATSPARFFTQRTATKILFFLSSVFQLKEKNNPDHSVAWIIVL